MDMQTYHSPAGHQRRTLPWLVLVAGLAITAVLGVLSQVQVQQQRISQLEKIMKRVEANLTSRALMHEQFIEMVSQTYDNPQYTIDQVRAYISELDIHRHYPEITTITLLRRSLDENSVPTFKTESLYSSRNVPESQLADLQRQLGQPQDWSYRLRVNRSSIMQVNDSTTDNNAYYLLYKATGSKKYNVESQRDNSVNLIMSVDVRQLVDKTLNSDRSFVGMQLVNYMVEPNGPIADIQTVDETTKGLVFFKSVELNGLPLEVSLKTLPAYSKLIGNDYRMLFAIAGVVISVMLFLFLRSSKSTPGLAGYALTAPSTMPAHADNMVDDMLRGLHLDEREADLLREEEPPTSPIPDQQS